MLVTCINLLPFFDAEQVKPSLAGETLRRRMFRIFHHQGHEGHKGIKVKGVFSVLRKRTAPHVAPGEIIATRT
jgi:hypothetical protein